MVVEVVSSPQMVTFPLEVQPSLVWWLLVESFLCFLELVVVPSSLVLPGVLHDFSGLQAQDLVLAFWIFPEDCGD